MARFSTDPGAISLHLPSGGMHHAYSSAGMGWCPFADIYLAIRRLREASGGAVQKVGYSNSRHPAPQYKVPLQAQVSGPKAPPCLLPPQVLYIDLDAHQGNGVERDKLRHGDTELFVLDMYNAGVFPKDDEAKAAIDIAVELRSGTTAEAYLSHLEAALQRASREFPKPDLVIYNAGTDVLSGDPLGRMGVDEAAVVDRDEAVWRFAAETARAPIVMVLSGGYAARSAAVVVDSISNLFNKFGLSVAPIEDSDDTPGHTAHIEMTQPPPAALD